MRTLSEIRREIRALQRKYHRELTIYRMRRVSEEVHHDYARAVADRQDPPRPLEIIRRIADRGFRLTTWLHLHNYLDEVREAGDIPEPRRMRNVRLWRGCWPCCLGPGRRSTTICCCVNSRRQHRNRT